MLTSVRFDKISEKALRHVADNMRQADMNEVMASNGNSPYDALVRSVELSNYNSVMSIDDEPVAIFGLVLEQALAPCGVPWLLGTNGIRKKPVSFMKATHKIIDHMLELCPMLANYVHTENKESISFLKKSGFIIEEARPIGINGELFHRFYKENSDV